MFFLIKKNPEQKNFFFASLIIIYIVKHFGNFFDTFLKINF